MVKPGYDRIMRKLLPSRVSLAIDQLFGLNRNGVD